MKHIHTTLYNVNCLKSAAKKRKKEKGIQLFKALDELAGELGYVNYNHVIVCYKNTKIIEEYRKEN